MAKDDLISRSAWFCLAAEGQIDDTPATWRAHTQERQLNIAVLTATNEQACIWSDRLETVIATSEPPRWPAMSIQLHVQSWSTPLTGTYDEIHVMGTSALAFELHEELAAHTELLSLHCFLPQKAPSGFSWRSEDELAAFLVNLVAALSGKAHFGLLWDDYRLHHTQVGLRQGTAARSEHWDALLQEVSRLVIASSSATSALLFLDGQQLTIGEFAEAYGVLEQTLPAKCLISVGTLRGQNQQYGFSLLLTTSEKVPIPVNTQDQDNTA